MHLEGRCYDCYAYLTEIHIPGKLILLTSADASFLPEFEIIIQFIFAFEIMD